MRTIYRLNGKKIELNAQHTIDGVTYPNLRDNWQSLGVEEVQVEDYPEPQLYTWTENADGTLNVTAIPQEEIDRRNQININNASLAYLAETDWYVTRHAENGTSIPIDVVTKRQAARDAIVKLPEVV